MADVILLGALGKRFGRRFSLPNVRTPADAIRHLCGALPGFRHHLQQFSEPGYHVLVGAESQAFEALENPSGQATIRIMPAVAGAGGKGLFQTILGGVLALVGTLYAMPWLTKIGIAMALGGVSQMMAPSPRMNNKGDADDPGHSFNGVDNVVAQGQHLPVLYGRARIGSLVVSCGASAETNFPSGAGGGPFGANEGTWEQMSSTGGVSAWHNGGDGDTIPLVWNVDPA